MRTSSSPRISALNEQPTPQYAHVVITERVGAPIVSRVFSVNAPVGHACTQAPHETHSLSINDVPEDETRASKPRFSIVSANVPCTSSHARTQRLQTMHSVESNVKYGFVSSFTRPRCVFPS